MSETLYLAHHGVKGQKWGVRRYQNEDGSLTSEGRQRLGLLRKKRDNYYLTEKKTNRGLRAAKAGWTAVQTVRGARAGVKMDLGLTPAKNAALGAALGFGIGAVQAAVGGAIFKAGRNVYRKNMDKQIYKLSQIEAMDQDGWANNHRVSGDLSSDSNGWNPAKNRGTPNNI